MRSFFIVALFIFCFINVSTSQNKANRKLNKSKKDTKSAVLEIKKDSLKLNDSVNFKKSDTTIVIKKDTTAKINKKSDIETTINYSAEDSITLDAEDKTATLYQKAKVIFGTKDIQANKITINYKKNQVDATHKIDSTGKKIGVPVFKEGSETYVAEEIKYNYKTKRGLVKEIITKQGEGFIHGEILKKDSVNNMFVNHAIYTTCNLKHPHFAIKANKIKMVSTRKIVSGPFYMTIGDVPTPLAFIFGFFPVPKRRSSGLIMPEYGESRDRGFFFRNGGVYLTMGDNVGVALKGDIYTLGGWALRTNVDYHRRYKYTGLFSLQYNKFVKNPDIDYLKEVSTDLWVSWNHRPELKGKSYQFSANVNAGSSNFNSRASFNPTQRQTANFNSSINFSKTFRKIPFFMNVTARQDQNVTTKTMTFDLPTANISMNRQMPFKNVIKSNKAIWEPIKKMGVSYSLDFVNRINNINQIANPGYNVLGRTARFYRSDTIRLVSDTAQLGKELSRFFGNAKYGVRHSVPIATTLKLFKYFSLNPSMNFSEYWYQRKFKYTNWNKTDTAVRIDTVSGLARAHTYNFNTNLTTRIYGTIFIKKGNIEALRHTIVPTIGFSYVPDLSRSVTQNVIVGEDKNGNEIRKTENRFEDAVGLGSPSRSLSKNLNFGLSNTFELKIRDKTDTVKKSFKKIMLIDNLSASGFYNLAADSFKLSNIGISARTKLFNRFDINFNANLDPYAFRIDSVGKNDVVSQTRIKEYAIAKGQGLGNINNYNLSVGTSFGPKKAKSAVKNKNSFVEPYELRMIRNNYLQYVDWNIPWGLSVSYLMNYNKIGFNKSKFDNNITISGNLSVTEKWKVTSATSYNVNTKTYGYTNVGIIRDLHCWDLSFSWVPFGLFQSYSVNLAVKAASLRDLKLSRQRSWYDN